MWRRSEYGRFGGRVGDDGGAHDGCAPPGGSDDESIALGFMRVGACADELRLMGVTRDV